MTNAQRIRSMTDDHLAHMLTRAMMCFATARTEEKT